MEGLCFQCGQKKAKYWVCDRKVCLACYMFYRRHGHFTRPSPKTKEEREEAKRLRKLKRRWEWEREKERRELLKGGPPEYLLEAAGFRCKGRKKNKKKRDWEGEKNG